MKLWAGRFSKEADKKTNDFNSSIKTDSRMFNEDIDGSIAHASMLAAKGIISEEDCKKILAGLSDIRNDIISGELMIDPDAEDIHTFIEGELTSRIGDAGKRLHTGRSRNDQVAVDIRLYLKKDVPQVTGLINGLIDALDGKAKEYAQCIMPGYTHLQRAQPITFAAHIGAYIEMLRRDLGRFEDAAERMNLSPLGSGALAGTTYPIDRAMTAKALGFDGYMPNTLDGVSDRDFCLELLSACSILMVHISRLCEEIIMWCSWEFKFAELDDAFSTGSSIMPQKKESRPRGARARQGRACYRRPLRTAHDDERSASCIQQRHAGGQGRDFRRHGHSQNVSDGSDSDDSDNEDDSREHEKGCRRRIHKRDRLRRLPRFKGIALPRCI